MMNHIDAINVFLSRLESNFCVTLPDARTIVEAFHREMSAGLAGKESSLQMIPSFVGRPCGAEKGRYLALDLGGTNIRVLAVELDGNRNAAIRAVSRFVIEQDKMCATGEELFDYIADCIHLFFKEHGVDVQRTFHLSFTFSFPVAQSSLTSGRLIAWTKKFTACNVEGQDVVALLTAALARRRMEFIRVAALANDTVGTLVAGSYFDPSCDMGVILGTGTNACYPERSDRILKCPEPGAPSEMIINMEWGGFSQLKTNIYDRLLDEASPNPGRQRLEKMVSGMYLGELARLIIVDMMTKGLLFCGVSPDVFSGQYLLHTEQLSGAAAGFDFFADFGLTDVSETDSRTIREISRIISARSARIAAAAIAAVVTWMDAKVERFHTIAIDGALFEKYPGYPDCMIEILHDLLGEGARRIRLAPVRDGSGIGSAIIGAVALHNHLERDVNN